MKTKSFLLSTLAVFIFAGCSSEDAREGNIPGGELDGKTDLCFRCKVTQLLQEQ